jgi:hypothetical protein
MYDVSLYDKEQFNRRFTMVPALILWLLGLPLGLIVLLWLFGVIGH